MAVVQYWTQPVLDRSGPRSPVRLSVEVRQVETRRSGDRLRHTSEHEARTVHAGPASSCISDRQMHCLRRPPTRSSGAAPPALIADGRPRPSPAGSHQAALRTQGERRTDARGIIRSPLNANYALRAPLQTPEAVSSSGHVHYWTPRPGQIRPAHRYCRRRSPA